MIVGALASGCLMALVALVGVGNIGSSDTTSVNPANSPSSYISSSYIPQYHSSSYDTYSYNAQREKLEEYSKEFQRLLKNFKFNGSHTPGTNVGIDIENTNITSQDWNDFCRLKDTNEEFNIYAGELLYSQAENLFEQLKTYLDNAQSEVFNRDQNTRNALATVMYPTALIAEQLKLQPQHHRSILGQVYSLQTLYSLVNSEIPTMDHEVKQLITECVNNGILLKDDLSSFNEETKKYIRMIQTTIKYSLAFWNWKQNRRYTDIPLTMPLMLDNGKNRCWLQTGFYMLYSLTANDNLESLGNWGKFMQYLKQKQRQQFPIALNAVKTKYDIPNLTADTDKLLLGGILKYCPQLLRINLVNSLNEFCASNNIINSKELKFLNSEESNGKNSVEYAIELFRKIFPELNNKKFGTGEAICELSIDPVLAIHITNPKPGHKEYDCAPIAIRHLIPGLHSKNDGIGKEPAGVSCPNQYGEYKLKISPNGKLLVYELRGMALSEHLPEFKKGPIEQVFDGSTRYSVLPSCHARSVIKLDASPNWYYCDSNGMYFGANSLQKLFRDKRSIMDYERYEDKRPLPANHATLLMYHLIDNKLWSTQSA